MAISKGNVIVASDMNNLGGSPSYSIIGMATINALNKKNQKFISADYIELGRKEDDSVSYLHGMTFSANHIILNNYITTWTGCVFNAYSIILSHDCDYYGCTFNCYALCVDSSLNIHGSTINAIELSVDRPWYLYATNMNAYNFKVLDSVVIECGLLNVQNLLLRSGKSINIEAGSGVVKAVDNRGGTINKNGNIFGL